MEVLEDRTVPSATPTPLTGLSQLVGSFAPAAATPTAVPDNPVPGPAQSDLDFLNMAAIGNMKEIVQGGLASQLGRNPDVQAFGWQLVYDHSNLLVSTLGVLQAEQLPLPDLDEQARADIQQVTQLRGLQFDRAFADYMVQDHLDDLQMFRQEVRHGSDPLIRGLAAGAIPVLEEHLEIALNLQNELSGGGFSGSGHGGGGTGGPGAGLSDSDLAFLEHAAQGNMFEIIVGGIASQLGSDPGVRHFGQVLVADHSQALADMGGFFGDQFSLPGLGPDHVMTIAQLGSLNGDNFDPQFVDTMVQDHREDVALFRQEARNADSPDVQDYAAAHLPALRHHLRIALRLQNKPGG
jgi:putative membrane protein